MNKEEFKVTRIINIPREEINCSCCKHYGKQTCVPYGLSCQYESIFPYRRIRLNQAQWNRINEIVRNLLQENKQLKDQLEYEQLLNEKILYRLTQYEYEIKELRGDSNE